MTLVNPTQITDGSTATAASVNNPINALATAINGNLDATNLADGAVTQSKIASTVSFDWIPSAIAAPSTVTYNGNRNYTLVFNTVDYTSKLSPGMRLKLSRTITAPTLSTSLNGTTQYYNKTSPAGVTFTNNFVASAWIKLSSYPSTGSVISRIDAASNNGWGLRINSSGQVVLIGFNAGSANFSQVQSYQSVPLNKWVHIAAQLDMATFTATTTTSYVMIDGIDVPASVTRGGTNPTALVQAGDLVIGARTTPTDFFPGKIAQVALYSAKVTQATIAASTTQTLAGTETSLVSAYSFNNSITDLNANANNLTANASAVATNADSPFAGGSSASTANTAGTTEFALIQTIAFSTNTTVVVQVPESYAIPTTGGISAVSYSSVKAPLGFPGVRGKWKIFSLNKVFTSQGSPVAGTWYNPGSNQLNIPIGDWTVAYEAVGYANTTTSVNLGVTATLSTSVSSETDSSVSSYSEFNTSAVTSLPAKRETDVSLSVATPYYLNLKYAGTATFNSFGFFSATAPATITAIPAGV